MLEQIIYIRIATLLLRIQTFEPFAFNVLSYLKCKDIRKKPHISIKIQPHVGKHYQIDCTKTYYSLFYPKKTSSHHLLYMVKVFIEYILLRYNILFLHGASCIFNKKGYVFCGPSGVGKTTIAQHNKGFTLSDETAILKKINNVWYIFSSPFDYKVNIAFNKMHTVNTIFYLNQSFDNKIQSIPLQSKINLLLSASLFYLFVIAEKSKNKSDVSLEGPFLQNGLLTLYTSITNLITQIPVYKLFFTKNCSFYHLPYFTK